MSVSFQNMQEHMIAFNQIYEELLNAIKWSFALFKQLKLKVQKYSQCKGILNIVEYIKK